MKKMERELERINMVAILTRRFSEATWMSRGDFRLMHYTMNLMQFFTSMFEMMLVVSFADVNSAWKERLNILLGFLVGVFLTEFQQTLLRRKNRGVFFQFIAFLELQMTTVLLSLTAFFWAKCTGDDARVVWFLHYKRILFPVFSLLVLRIAGIET